jgi:DNA-binding beta-propeller fold protein YncE
MMPAVPPLRPRPRRLRVPIALAAVAGTLLVAAGCGGPAAGTDLPHAAVAPPVTRTPAGTVVALPGDPGSLAVDTRDGLLAAGVTDPDGVALLSTSTGREEKRIRLAGAPARLALTRSQQSLLVPLGRAGQLVQLSLPSGHIEYVAHLKGQPDDAVAASSATVFVSNGSSSTVSLVQNGVQVADEPAPRQPGGVATSANGTEVVVLGMRARTIEAFSYSGRSLGSAPAGVGPTHVVASGRDLFYVADTEGNAIDVIRLGAGPKQVATVATRTGAPYGLALDQTRGLLYVTLTSSNELESFRVRGASVVPDRVWPTVRQPDAVAVDPATGRVFVASRTGGGLELIDP